MLEGVLLKQCTHTHRSGNKLSDYSATITLYHEPNLLLSKHLCFCLILNLSEPY